jgi:predicted nucleic acid-binding protein
LFPDAGLATVGPDAARIAAPIYRTLKRPRSREIDIAIAACAIEQGAALWTANPDDFNDIPGCGCIAADRISA